MNKYDKKAAWEKVEVVHWKNVKKLIKWGLKHDPEVKESEE